MKTPSNRHWASLLLLFVAPVRLTACSADGKLAPKTEPAAAEAPAINETVKDVRAAEILTITSVDAADGTALSTEPNVSLPNYVVATEADDPAPRLAQLDYKLLFTGDEQPASPFSLGVTIDLNVIARSDGAPTTLSPSGPRYEFPKATNEFEWELSLSDGAALGNGSQAPTDAAGSAEWSAWRAFEGLAVSAAGASSKDSAMSLGFATQGTAPLRLTEVDATHIQIRNDTDHRVDGALLIYSHAGGVGLRALGGFEPGASVVAMPGPKEMPAAVLLEQGEMQLQDLLTPKMGEVAARTVALARSDAWLSEHGWRVIYVAPKAWHGYYPRAVIAALGADPGRTLIGHAELIKDTHIAQVETLLLQHEGAVEDFPIQALGRFAKAKLQRAAAIASPEAAKLAAAISAQN